MDACDPRPLTPHCCAQVLADMCLPAAVSREVRLLNGGCLVMFIAKQCQWCAVHSPGSLDGSQNSWSDPSARRTRAMTSSGIAY